MKRSIKLFWLFSVYSIKGLVQQPLSVVLLLFGKILRFSVLFMFLYFLISHTKVLAGYTLNQTMIFFMTFYFIGTLEQLLFREVYRFRPLVLSGELDTIIVKPYHPFFRILTGGIDLMDMIVIVPYTLLLIYFVSTASASFFHIVLFCLLLINALVISAAFHIMVLAIGILLTEVNDTIMIYRDLTRLGMVPVDIYKEPIQFIITFIIPIGIMLSVPSKALFGMVALPVIITSFIIGGILLIASISFWNYALKKYQSWGG